MSKKLLKYIEIIVLNLELRGAKNQGKLCSLKKNKGNVVEIIKNHIKNTKGENYQVQGEPFAPGIHKNIS